MADLIVKNGLVVTMDPTRRVIRDGAVAVEGSRIVAVGMTADILAAHQAPEVIDATDRMVIPGLIDGHNHPFAYLIGGLADEVDIFTTLYKHFYPYEVHVNADEAYSCAMGNYVEMIRNGTTCFNDPGGYHVDQTAQAAVDIGIRGIVNRSTRDIAPAGKPVPKELFDDLETNLREGEKVVQTWHGAADDRIRAWFSLRYVFNISDELVAGIRDLARQYDVGVHCHVAAVKGENEAIQEIFGKRSLERYYDLGLFGPNLYCVHMGYPNEREVDWLVEHDVKVAHCPSAAMMGAWGILVNKMIPYMIDKGVTVSLGSDTNGAAGSLDMFRVMYVGATMHRDLFDDPTLIGAYKALEMATIEGARACLWENDIGSLETGKKADIVLVDMTPIEWSHPGRDPIRSLVYSANGSMVDTVIIDGRVIMRDRVILTVDADKIRHDVIAAGEAWMDRADIAVDLRWPID
jgi:cytosine/adenosine deaminase-related metal-dependent hydrolase